MGSQSFTSAPLEAENPFFRRALFTFSGAHFLNDLVTTGMVPALVVMYKHALHLNYTQSTLIVLVSYFTSSVTQPVFGMLTDRKPRVWLFSLGVFLSIAGLSLTAIVPSLPWLLVFIALSGFGSGVFHPEASRGTHFASGYKKGLAQAIFQVGGNAGQAFGPLMIPLFLVHTGIHGLIWLLPVALLSLILTAPPAWLDEQQSAKYPAPEKRNRRKKPYSRRHPACSGHYFAFLVPGRGCYFSSVLHETCKFGNKRTVELCLCRRRGTGHAFWRHYFRPGRHETAACRVHVPCHAFCACAAAFKRLAGCTRSALFRFQRPFKLFCRRHLYAKAVAQKYRACFRPVNWFRSRRRRNRFRFHGRRFRYVRGCCSIYHFIFLAHDRRCHILLFAK